MVNSEFFTQTKFKDDAEAFSKMKQGHASNKPPDAVGEQKNISEC